MLKLFSEASNFFEPGEQRIFDLTEFQTSESSARFQNSMGFGQNAVNVRAISDPKRDRKSVEFSGIEWKTFCISFGPSHSLK